MNAPRPALERIVVGIDFKSHSIEAARWVASVFARGAELVMTHALDSRASDGTEALGAAASDGAPDLQAVTQQLHELARAIGLHGTYRAEVREDVAARAILAVATEVGADLIVVGPHGGRETTRGIGTTAERLIRMSPVPVLLVTNPRRRAPKHLLVPVDGGRLTHLVVDWAESIARRTEGEMILMHVFDPHLEDDDTSGTPRDTRWLSNLAEEGPSAVTTKSLTVVGKPAEQILAAASRLDADLVVIGRRGRRRALSGVVGSTASDLLRHSSWPVLIIVDPPDALFDEWGGHIDSPVIDSV